MALSYYSYQENDLLNDKRRKKFPGPTIQILTRPYRVQTVKTIQRISLRVGGCVVNICVYGEDDMRKQKEIHWRSGSGAVGARWNGQRGAGGRLCGVCGHWSTSSNSLTPKNNDDDVEEIGEHTRHNYNNKLPIPERRRQI